MSVHTMMGCLGRGLVSVVLVSVVMGIGLAGSAAAASSTLLGVREDGPRDTANAAELAAIVRRAGARSVRAPCLRPGDTRAAVPGGADFAALDRFVGAYQADGLTELVVCLEPGPVARDGVLVGSRLPIPPPEALEEFTQWVGGVVERYDADGRDDMPGLRRMVRIFEIGSGLAGRRPAAVDAYLPLLEQAYRAAHAANDSVLIAHAALLVTGLAEGTPARARTGELSREERDRLLERPELFDLLNLQTVSGAGALDRSLVELGAAMTARGIRKPILVSDAAPPPLVAFGSATECEASEDDRGIVIPPAQEAERCALADLFRALIERDSVALDWAHGFAASDLIRKAIVAADRGVWVIVLAPLTDGDWWRHPALRASAGLTPWSGLLGENASDERPALRALAKAAALLAELEALDRVREGRADERLYAIRSAVGEEWIAWLDTPGVALPSKPSASRVIHFRTDSPRVSVGPLLGGDAVTLRTLDGVAWIEITREPVRVRPVAD